jgi:hypothetical protein
MPAALASARPRPGAAKSSEAALDRAVRARLNDLAGFLARMRPDRAREFYWAVFPDELTVKPVVEGRRTVWDMTGAARLELSNTTGDPTGT